MASPGRSGQGGLSLQTVVVASVASAAAAVLTSRLLPPGATIFTAAMTPVIVAVVSDLLHRPARRVQELRTRRTEVMREPVGTRALPGEGRWAPIEEGLDHLRDEPWPPSPNGAPGGRATAKRRLHPKWIVATAGIAFVLAMGALTIPELLFGGALGSDKRTTVFGGADAPAERSEPRREPPSEREEAPPAQDGAPEEAPAQTAPTDPEASPQPTETTPAPAPAPEEEPPAQTPVVPESP